MTTPHGGSESHSIGKQQAKGKIERKEIYMKLDLYIEKIVRDSISMHDAFKEYCKAAKDGGLTSNEAWRYIYTKLKDRVPKSTLYEWGNAELPGGTKITKPMNKKIPDPESFALKGLPDLTDRTVSAAELYKEQEKEIRIDTKVNPVEDDMNATSAQIYPPATINNLNSNQSLLEGNDLLHFQISLAATDVWNYMIDHSPLLSRENENDFCVNVVLNKKTRKVISARIAKQ